MGGTARSRVGSSGVSPVVGTILLVAITIVLVAMLFVFAAGLLGGGSGGTLRLTFGEPVEAPTVPGQWHITVAGVSSSESLAGFQVEVYNGTDVAIPVVDLLQVRDTGASGGGLNLTFFDVGGSGRGRLSVGDAFIVDGAAEGRTYAIYLVSKTTGDVVQTATFP